MRSKTNQVKLLIGLCFIALLLVLVLWPEVSGTRKKLSLISDIDLSTLLSQNTEMIQPNLKGVDADGRIYAIKAERAIQQNETQVKLLNLNSNFEINDKQMIYVEANEGLYDNARRTITLMDKVIVKMPDNIEARAPLINIDINSSQSSGNEGIEATSPKAKISADDFRFDHRKKIYHFKNNVHAILHAPKS